MCPNVKMLSCNDMDIYTCSVCWRKFLHINGFHLTIILQGRAILAFHDNDNADTSFQGPSAADEHTGRAHVSPHDSRCDYASSRGSAVCVRLNLNPSDSPQAAERQEPTAYSSVGEWGDFTADGVTFCPQQHLDLI